MVNDLIRSIGTQLNIPYSDDRERIGQIIYSVAGKMALASLWDHGEGEDDVSIQHFKRRAKKVLDAYSAVYPSVKALLPEDKTGLIGDIYEIYLRTGHFYHSAFRISPAAHAWASYSNCVLHRGVSPDDKLFMSGLGFYSVQNIQTVALLSSMFDLQTQSFDEYLAELLSGNDWERVDWPENTEFLRLDPPFGRGYWQQSPIGDQRITLARYGEPNKIYVFCRFRDDHYEQQVIPNWRVRNDHAPEPDNYEEYRRIATALLMRYGTLPPIRATKYKGMVEISVGYRLPPTEEDFFRLYSWPNGYDITPYSQKVFTRRMSKAVYPLFRDHLESLGYQFVEG